MRPIDAFRLVLLAAIWGASFVLIRVVVPVLGPVFLSALRVLLAALALAAYARATGFDLELRRHWRAYLLIGTVNSAAPFVLFAYAAVHLPASYSVVFNATSPLFGALFAAVWLADRMTLRRAVGIAGGLLGVALLVGFGPVAVSHDVVLASLAALGGACCYALAGVVSKKSSDSSVKPLALATGSQIGAAVLLAPGLAAMPDPGLITPVALFWVAALAVGGSAVAYLLYFRLLADIGPAKALTVTFLVPLFGIVLGAMFLGERLSLIMLLGAALVLFATWMVAGQRVPANVSA